jgi:acyl carrier protein
MDKAAMTFSEILADEFEGKISLQDVIEDVAMDSMDSLEYLQFTQRLEKEFGVTLKDEDVQKAVTFRDLQELVEKLKR